MDVVAVVYSLAGNGGELWMRRTLAWLTSLALIATAAPATALAGGVFIGLGGAAGDVDFDSDFDADRVTSDDSVVGEWQVGYRFDSKFVIEGGGSVGMSLDTFLFGDAFVLSDYRVMVGYAFQPAERFSIVPRLGVSFWDLKTDEEILLPFIPGSRLLDFGESGSDLMFRVSFEWRVAQRLHLYAAYTEAHYDIGDSSAPSFGFKFQF
jgi:hypothetical protein